ncbi:hypothetical protein [Kocuria massiliensis]|uniref:hypothetical protein n=1 Tax=Kocuria massiliensis TaxID=1926282 RepID=UPI0022B99646|nr:hypothetical protein [Kocuria massiliensis]
MFSAPLEGTIRLAERDALERFDAWLAEELRAAKEQAWNEGYDAGETKVWERFTEDHQDSPKLTNPYRKDNA